MESANSNKRVKQKITENQKENRKRKRRNKREVMQYKRLYLQRRIRSNTTSIPNIAAFYILAIHVVESML